MNTWCECFVKHNVKSGDWKKMYFSKSYFRSILFLFVGVAIFGFAIENSAWSKKSENKNMLYCRDKKNAVKTELEEVPIVNKASAKTEWMKLQETNSKIMEQARYFFKQGYTEKGRLFVDMITRTKTATVKLRYIKNTIGPVIGDLSNEIMSVTNDTLNIFLRITENEEIQSGKIQQCLCKLKLIRKAVVLMAAIEKIPSDARGAVIDRLRTIIAKMHATKKEKNRKRAVSVCDSQNINSKLNEVASTIKEISFSTVLDAEEKNLHKKKQENKKAVHNISVLIYPLLVI